MGWLATLLELGGVTAVFTAINWLFFYKQNKRTKDAEAGTTEMKYADEIALQYRRLVNEYRRLLCFRICDKRLSLLDDKSPQKNDDDETD
jgi:hypothetical protein